MLISTPKEAEKEICVQLSISGWKKFRFSFWFVIFSIARGNKPSLFSVKRQLLWILPRYFLSLFFSAKFKCIFIDEGRLLLSYFGLFQIKIHFDKKGRLHGSWCSRWILFFVTIRDSSVRRKIFRTLISGFTLRSISWFYEKALLNFVDPRRFMYSPKELMIPSRSVHF